MFKMLAVILALYTFYAMANGQVYAKSGPGGRMIYRHEEPRYFRVVTAIYFGLSLMLGFVF